VSRRLLVLAFDGDEDLLRAVRHARAAGDGIVEVFAPYPVHGLPEAQGLPPSRLPWVCLAGGLFGLLGGFALQAWTSAVDWPLNVGGKPLLSWPAFVPVAFELVILFAGLATVAAFLHRERLRPGRRVAVPLPRTMDDRFALVLAPAGATYVPEAAQRTYRERFGAVETLDVLEEDRP
jgi:hypothetical protein